jgi:hypothetical protein
VYFIRLRNVYFVGKQITPTMYRYFYVIVFVLFGFSMLRAQTAYQRTAGTVSGERNYHLAVTNGGNLIATGYTNAVSGNGDDGFLVKFNKMGRVQWAFTYGDVGDDYSWDVVVTRNNDILASGYTSSFSTPKNAATLSLLDSSGGLTWLSALYHNSVSIEFYRTLQTSTGHFLATGLMGSSSQSDEMVLAKFGPKGRLIWIKTYGSAGSDEVMGLMETTSGHYVLAGLANDANGYGSSDFAVIKTDTAGRMVWGQVYGGTDSERLNTCLELNGSYFFAGWSKGVGAGENDVVLLKTDSAGKVTWVNAYGSARSELVFNMLADPLDGNLILGGYTEKFSKTGQTDNRNTILLKIEPLDGVLIWSEAYGGSLRDGHWPTGLAISPHDQGYYALASTNSFAKGDYDLYLIKADTAGMGGCNQRKANFKRNKVNGWSAKGFGKVDNPAVVWVQTSLNGAKWSLDQGTECCELYAQAGKGDTLCPQERVFIGTKGIAGYTYQWYKSGSVVGSKGRLQVGYGSAGNYSLAVSSSSPGCSTKTSVLTMYDDNGPSPNRYFADTCDGQGVDFVLDGDMVSNTWYSINGQKELGKGNRIRIDTTDSFIYQAITRAGCTYVDTLAFESLAIPAISLPDSITFCLGDSAFAAPIVSHSYSWTGTSVTDTGLWLSHGGYYTVVAQNGECAAIDSIRAVAHALPIPDLGPDFDTCFNAAVCLSLGGKYPYSYWNGMRTSMDTFCTVPGLVYVMAVDANGCSGTDSLQMGSLGHAVDIFDNDSVLLYKSPYLIDAGTWSAYSWWGDNIIGQDSLQTVEILIPGWVGVWVADSFGCTQSDSVFVDMADGIFTPVPPHLDIALFPNPALGQVNIVMPYTPGECHVVLYHASGKVVSTLPGHYPLSNPAILDVSTLAPGLYLVVVECGDLAYHARFSKE